MEFWQRIWYYLLGKVRGNMESALSIKGQATIPKSIRDHLKLKPGDRVKFFLHPDGSVVILPKISVTALRGIAATTRKKAASIDEMRTAAVAAAAKRFRRGAKP
jgi:antitoxin PrlF